MRGDEVREFSMRPSRVTKRPTLPVLKNRLEASLGRYQQQAERTVRLLDEHRFSERIWAKDPSLWKPEPEVQEKIQNRLGWLSITEPMVERTGEMTAFVRSVKAAGFTHAVLMGMGGSSLCPEVLRQTFGVKTGYPELHVLDSTDPATIRRVEKSITLRRTLFIVASKSGTTAEVQALYQYFSEKVRSIQGNTFGQNFIAITDPGTSLERLGRDKNFRRIFLNPPDIGGRYSALSYFGLIPAALIGIDLEPFLERAHEMMRACALRVPAADHPGIQLGAILGMLAKEGRDKMTFITDHAIGSLGVWIEQLVAESTGKEGKGLIPVDGEEIGSPLAYDHDRIFIYTGLNVSRKRVIDRKLDDLEHAGHPIIRIHLRDTMDLAGEFYRWEMATAVAGTVMEINPFDEPNVAESKKNTRKVLEAFQKTGRFAPRESLVDEQGIRLYGERRSGPRGSLKKVIGDFLNQTGSGNYVALMAYIEQSPIHDLPLQKIRRLIRNRFRVATTLGYGPRFLHSTGQLHKGGAGNGLFIQITAEEAEDIPVPGEKYTFGTLKRAQALGDYHSLNQRGFRVMQIHMGKDVKKDLQKLTRLIGTSLKQ